MQNIEDVVGDKFDDGSKLPALHPDHDTDMEVKLGAVCPMLDMARATLERILTMNVVTPAAVAMKDEVRRTLANTHPHILYEQS